MIRPLTLLAVLAFPVVCNAQESNSLTATEFKAKQIFDQMQQSFRDAESLSFESKFDVELLGFKRSTCIYQVWLRKPNFFRIENRSLDSNEGGVIVGDGSDMWTYWPSGRPQFNMVPETADQRANRATSYMRKPAADASRISIGHQMPYLGYGMGFPIYDVSEFHGYIESLTKHIDGFEYLGDETIEENHCDKIKVTILNGQRLRYFWIARRDHLPRRIVEIVHMKDDVVTHEEWSNVRVNDEIADEKFVWKPPTGWQQWELPSEFDKGPLIGSHAPDFTMASIDGRTVRLSEFRGKVVWLNFWRFGCPPCFEELPYLQRIHENLEASGLALIGVNVEDDKTRLQELLETRRITYLNILDESPSGQKMYYQEYAVGSIPLNCVIDRSGVIVDAWVGYSKERATSALRKAGLKIDDHSIPAIRHDKNGEQ